MPPPSSPVVASLSLPFPEMAPPSGGGVRFVAAGDYESLGAASPLTLFASVLGEDISRGALPVAIEEAIESALRSRGAAAAGRAWTNLGDALSDQLFRARTIGATELALAIGPLESIADRRGALDLRDSDALRFFAEASRDRPVTLFIHASNANIRVFRDTVPLEDALEAAPPPPPPTPSRSTSRAVSRSTSRAVSRPAPEVTPAQAMVEEPAEVETVVVESPKERDTKRIVRSDPRHRAWAAELRNARGPQPLTVLERLFVEAYMPLSNAIECGMGDDDAIAAYTEFRSSFSKSYLEAASAFNTASRRPKMVLDAFDLATRSARREGARTTQLLLIDSMRWDIAAHLQPALTTRLASRATLTEETILWSALPTRTSRQLDALAHGVGSLRDPWPTDTEDEVVRGRTGDVIRKFRAGGRELLKLDTVETKLHEAGTDAFAALPAVTQKLTDILAKFVETLAPRTFLFVFGDHGFVIGKDGAKQGGASPEEVLVPAFGILVGGSPA